MEECQRDEDQLPASTKSTLGLRHVLFLLATFLQMAAVNSNFAVVGPFFPLHAQDVGMDSGDVAIVCGSYALVQLVMSPFAGALASRFGRKLVLVLGVFNISLSTFLFGVVEVMLPESSPKVWTFMYCLLRVLQGGGAALATTCIFAILTDAFPNDKGKVIGIANSMDGIGWSIGPPVGGLLFAAGGFRLPFLVLAPLPLLLLLFQLLSYPKLSADAASNAAVTQHLEFSESLSRSRRLVTRPLLLTSVVAAAWMSKWAFFNVTYTPWASSDFGLSITTVSIYFSIPAMAFLVCSPLGGCVADRAKHKKYLIGAGLCSSGVLMLSFYVLPWWLCWPAEVRLIAMTFYLLSEGVWGALIMPAMLPDMLDSAASAADCVTDAQQQDLQQQAPVPQKQDEHTINLITSMATTSYNLGGVVGYCYILLIPFMGVRGTSASVGALLISLAAMLLAYQLVSSRSAVQYITLAQHSKEVAKLNDPQQPVTIGILQEDIRGA